MCALVSPNIAERALYVVDGFVSALKQLPDAKNFAAFTFWTVIYWRANGYGMSLLTRAFDCSSAAGAVCVPLSLTVLQGFVVLSVLIAGLMIAGAPGSAGTFQAFVMLGLSVFVSSDAVNSSGIAYANVEPGDAAGSPRGAESRETYDSLGPNESIATRPHHEPRPLRALVIHPWAVLTPARGRT